MTTGERIRALRKSSRMSQLELAQKTGYTDRSSIAKIEANRAELTETKIKAFAEVFGITPAELLGITETAEDFPPPVIADNIVKIPILGEIAAGYDAEDYEDYSIGNMEIPPAWLHGRPVTDYFFLKVSGDSMFPMYQDGDYVLILKQSTMNYSGQIGAVVYDDNKTTLKRVEYIYGEDWMRLVPINPSYPPIMVENEALEHCRVIGIAKMVIREVR